MEIEFFELTKALRAAAALQWGKDTRISVIVSEFEYKEEHCFGSTEFYRDRGIVSRESWVGDVDGERVKLRDVKLTTKSDIYLMIKVLR